MNEEEKKAIERLKKDKNKPLACGDITIVNIDDLEIVLNYIENSIPNDEVATKIKTLVMEEEYGYIDNRKTIRVLQELLEKK